MATGTTSPKTDLHWASHPDPEVGKTQAIRLVDIWLLGPAMIMVGLTGRISTFTRVASVLGGVATILYNWRNYERLKALEETRGRTAGDGTGGS